MSEKAKKLLLAMAGGAALGGGIRSAASGDYVWAVAGIFVGIGFGRWAYLSVEPGDSL